MPTVAVDEDRALKAIRSFLAAKNPLAAFHRAAEEGLSILPWPEADTLLKELVFEKDLQAPLAAAAVYYHLKATGSVRNVPRDVALMLYKVARKTGEHNLVQALQTDFPGLTSESCVDSWALVQQQQQQQQQQTNSIQQPPDEQQQQDDDSTLSDEQPLQDDSRRGDSSDDAGARAFAGQLGVPESRGSLGGSLPGAPAAFDSVAPPSGPLAEPAVATPPARITFFRAPPREADNGNRQAAEPAWSPSSSPAAQAAAAEAAEAEMAALVERQADLETKAVEMAAARYKKLAEEVTRLGKGAALKPTEALLLHWFQPLRAAIESDQQDIRDILGADKSKTGKWGHIPAGSFKSPDQMPVVRKEGEFLLKLTAEKMAVIVMHTVMGMLLHHTEGVPFTSAALEVGKAVQAEFNMQRLKEVDAFVHRMVVKSGKASSVNQVLRSTQGSLEDSDWKQSSVAFVGGNLLGALIRSAFVPEDGTVPTEQRLNERAFRHFQAPLHQSGPLEAVEPTTGSFAGTVGMLGVHDKIYKMVEAGHDLRDMVHARFLPMLVPPRDWCSPTTGGYLYAKNVIMRPKHGSRLQLDELDHADSAHQLDRIYEGLNTLGKTAWKINRPVYEVVCEAWEKGGDLAELPSRSDLPIPPAPADTQDREVMRAWYRQMNKVTQHNSNLHSLRCDIKYKLEVAHEFLNEKKFYFPHNMDFRGRVYPIPPHLNHLGSDFCRGLLEFYEGRPLGPNGLTWLKIHLSNLCGNDKVSFEQRLAFADKNMDDIFDSADNPLSGRRWWTTAEDAWQCLATCKEITNAIRSGNPETFVSHLPVHQDGTCNGLQHYAALGGDVHGAQQVNVLPSDKPQDVYSGIVELVKKRIAEDIKNGEPLAIMLDGKVTRKIIKQTVMTSVYGVTWVGARKQIASQLKDRQVVAEDDIMKASVYLTRLTFASLKEMFLGARTIMDWLTECARLIAKASSPVKWTTPLGLPIMQPYRTPGTSKEFIKTIVQTISLHKPDNRPVNVMRQKSAFPPNFVHSLDSTHMLLTALECAQQGLVFASVHDSFWTHAGDVEKMNAALRAKFIELHSQPLLEQLLDGFKREYPTVTFPPIPPRGELDLSKVADSKYFFN